MQFASDDARARAYGADRIKHKAGAATDLEDSLCSSAVTAHQPRDEFVTHLKPEVPIFDPGESREGGRIEPHVRAINLGSETWKFGADDERVAASGTAPACRPQSLVVEDAISGRADRADTHRLRLLRHHDGRSLRPTDVRKLKFARIRDIAKSAAEMPGRKTIAQLHLGATRE